MLNILNDLIWSKVLIIMLIGLGLYFTIASRFVQFRYFANMFSIFGEAFQRHPGQISSFQALMLSVAGRVGAGQVRAAQRKGGAEGRRIRRDSPGDTVQHAHVGIGNVSQGTAGASGRCERSGRAGRDV